MRTPILGGSYAARSVNAADNRMINLYPEAVPEGGKELGFLTRAPGLRLLATAGTGPIRGAHRINGTKGYVVSGQKLYSVSASWAVTELGTVSGSGPVSMADNGTQLFIACNPGGYIYNATTGVFGAITDPDFPGAPKVGYLDGYFVFIQPDTQKIWVTALLDGTSIDALEFASAEGAPDNLVSLIIDHREAWLFGSDSIEVWYNAGGADFPLARIQGAFIEAGCIATHSVAKMDNSVFWLSSDARGNGIVYRANGYTPQRISNHAIESALNGYSSLSDAIAYTYQQEGHSFYVLTFPTDSKTWAFDAATNEWTERAGLTDGLLTRHRSNCQMSFGGEIVVGDFENGNIYALDTTTYADNGSPQKWVRSWRAIPTGKNSLKRTMHHSLQIDCETGVGLLSGQGEDPVMVLRWSDDGGHTWSNEHQLSMGKMGEYRYRAIMRRLGSSRDRVYELSGTDPVKITIMGAELKISEGGS
jgi:hypothetical protein